MKKFIFFALISLSCIGTTKSQTIVTFYTNMGSFEVFLYDTLKPITAGNFKTLVENEYYDGIIFHRIISNFVIQGGDPTGTGSGGPGYTIPDEFDSSLSNIEKTLSMANSGPNTGGSQFFINTKNNTFLDFDKNPLTSAHPVFGIVISGWDTVEMIEAVAVNGNNRPLNDVIMDSIRVNAPPVGVKNLPKTTHISKVYPNPITNESVLSIHSTSSSQTRITLFNQAGNQLSSINRNLTTGKNSIHLGDLLPKGLAAGVYYIAIANGVEVVQERIVVL